MKDTTIIAVTAMLCITILESAAMLARQDGQLFLAAIGVFTAIGAWTLKDIKKN
jgi:hypothetical protein